MSEQFITIRTEALIRDPQRCSLRCPFLYYAQGTCRAFRNAPLEDDNLSFRRCPQCLNQETTEKPA